MAQPFLKWAGGKRWLASTDLGWPPTYDRYIEPFLGSAAIFFALRPERALLSDINSELINLYEVMRDAPSRLRCLLEVHQARHCKEHYYSVRAALPVDPVESAARTLYLNRTCWNGLYRVNLKGQFNVPIGTKNSVLMPTDDFEAVSGALQKADIRCCDFEVVIDGAREGDLLFLDPPYTVKHNVNGFVKYNERIFTWADQIRLRDAVVRAIDRQATVIVTNADHPSIIELYAGVAEYRKLPRASVIAASAERRGSTSEAMFAANLGATME